MENKKTRCPCAGCISVLFCRWKRYLSLVMTCKLLDEYLFENYKPDPLSPSPRPFGFNIRISKVEKSVKPKFWKYDKENDRIIHGNFRSI